MLLNKNVSGVLFFQTAWSLDLGKSKRDKAIRRAKSDLGAKLTDTSLLTPDNLATAKTDHTSSFQQ